MVEGELDLGDDDDGCMFPMDLDEPSTRGDSRRPSEGGLELPIGEFPPTMDLDDLPADHPLRGDFAGSPMLRTCLEQLQRRSSNAPNQTVAA